MFHHHLINFQIYLFLSKTTYVFYQIYLKFNSLNFQKTIFVHLYFVIDDSFVVVKISLRLEIRNYLGNFEYLD